VRLIEVTPSTNNAMYHLVHISTILLVRASLLTATLLLAVDGVHAQTKRNDGKEMVLPIVQDTASIIPEQLPFTTGSPVAAPASSGAEMPYHPAAEVGSAGDYTQEGFSLFRPDELEHLQPPQPGWVDETNKYGFDYLRLYGTSSYHQYPYLMDRQSVAFVGQMRRNRLTMSASLLVNQYVTFYANTQVGISASLAYQLSPHWSMGLWGTWYQRNPYFGLSAFPFVASSSYGGWVKYQQERWALRLGAQNYYDAFQGRWRVEPIVTPTFRISNKVVMEFPFGPLLRDAAEAIFIKKNADKAKMIPGERRR
jgi:hypothetical protein